MKRERPVVMTFRELSLSFRNRVSKNQINNSFQKCIVFLNDKSTNLFKTSTLSFQIGLNDSLHFYKFIQQH